MGRLLLTASMFIGLAIAATYIGYREFLVPESHNKTWSDNVEGVSATYKQYNQFYPYFNIGKPNFSLTLADSVNGVTTDINAGSDTIVGNELSDFVKVTPHNTVTTYRGTGTVIQEGTYSEPLKITSAVTRPELDSVFAQATGEFNKYRHQLTGR